MRHVHDRASAWCAHAVHVIHSQMNIGYGNWCAEGIRIVDMLSVSVLRDAESALDLARERHHLGIFSRPDAFDLPRRVGEDRLLGCVDVYLKYWYDKVVYSVRAERRDELLCYQWIPTYLSIV